MKLESGEGSDLIERHWTRKNKARLICRPLQLDSDSRTKEKSPGVVHSSRALNGARAWKVRDHCLCEQIMTVDLADGKWWTQFYHRSAFSAETDMSSSHSGSSPNECLVPIGSESYRCGFSARPGRSPAALTICTWLTFGCSRGRRRRGPLSAWRVVWGGRVCCSFWSVSSAAIQPGS